MDYKKVMLEDFDSDLHRANWSAWWEAELERCLVVIDVTEKHRISFLPHFEGWDLEQCIFPVDPIIEYFDDWFKKSPLYGDSFPRIWPNFGAGILAAVLGSSVRIDANTIWFEPAPEYDWDTLSTSINQENFWWQWISKLIQESAKRWQGDISIGFPDLGGGLDILASLRGTENLLLDLSLESERVENWAKQITERWLEAYRDLEHYIPSPQFGSSCWAPIWCPGSYYMLQSDFSYMISPAMFEKYVLPDLDTLCGELDYSFYHLDGKGQLNHLDILLSIENLDGIQWVPGDGAPPPEEWLPELSRIRSANKLCQVYVSPEGAIKIAQELGPKGFTFMISPPPQEQEIPDILAKLQGLS